MGNQSQRLLTQPFFKIGTHQSLGGGRLIGAKVVQSVKVGMHDTVRQFSELAVVAVIGHKMKVGWRLL